MIAAIAGREVPLWIRLMLTTRLFMILLLIPDAAHPTAGLLVRRPSASAALFERRCHRTYVPLHCRLVSVPQAQVGSLVHVVGPAWERFRHVGASAQPNANFLRLPQCPEMPRLTLAFVRQPPAFPAKNAGSDEIEDSAAPAT